MIRSRRRTTPYSITTISRPSADATRAVNSSIGSRFYDLPPEFYREYHNRVQRFLCDVAADVLERR